MKKVAWSVAAGAFALVVCLSLPVRAANLTWTIDASQSTIQGSAVVLRNGAFFVVGDTQGPGSLTTEVSGTFVTNNPLTSLQVLSTNLTFASSGRWAPLPGGASGTAPAIYSSVATLGIPLMVMSMRDLATSYTTDAMPLVGAPANWTFPFATSDVSFLAQSNFDFQGQDFLSSVFGRIPFSANLAIAGGAGTLTQFGNGLTFSMPIQSTFLGPGPDTSPTYGAGWDFGGLGFVQMQLSIDGPIIATAVIPEPASVLLMATGAIGVVLLVREAARIAPQRAARRWPIACFPREVEVYAARPSDRVRVLADRRCAHSARL